MAWTAPRDWAVDEVLTAANMDTYVSDNLAYLKALTLMKSGTIAYPNSYYNICGAVCPVFRAPAALTITRIHISGPDATPTAEIAVDLKWADDLTAYTNAAVIDVCDTTSGVTTITAGFDDATIAANKYIYWSFDAAPHVDWKYMWFEIHYTVD